MNFSEEAVKPELFGTKDSARLVIQMTDDHDMELMESEAAELRERTGGEDWCLAAVPVKDWEQDLTPWPAEPVFGTDHPGARRSGEAKAVPVRLLAGRPVRSLGGISDGCIFRNRGGIPVGLVSGMDGFCRFQENARAGGISQSRGQGTPLPQRRDGEGRRRDPGAGEAAGTRRHAESPRVEPGEPFRGQRPESRKGNRMAAEADVTEN